MTPYQKALVFTLAIIGAAFLVFRYLTNRFFPSVLGTAPYTAPANDAPEPFDMGKFPYKWKEVRGVDALVEWEKAKAEGKGVPLVVGGEDGLRKTAEHWYFNGGKFGAMPEKTLAQADRNPDPLDISSWSSRTPRPWPVSIVLQDKMTVNLKLRQDPLPVVWIVYLPARDSVEIPAFLNLGGWNDCPEAAVQVAALRKWRDAYGAELVGVSSDTMDIRTARRPPSREEALRLACEHAEFCGDVVEDPNEQLEELAATLMASDWWFFWWD